MASDLKINFTNRSDVQDAKIVVFQPNALGGHSAVAWRVLQPGRSTYSFHVPRDVEVRVTDSFGTQLETPRTSDGREIEVVNGREGPIDVYVYKDGKLLATRIGVPPGQKAEFRFEPLLRIGVVLLDVAEGEIMSSAITADIMSTIPLNPPELNVVMTGGGSGPKSTPFHFGVYPMKGTHLLVHERDGWEYAERKSAREAVAVIAVTDDGSVILTEQYRRAVDARVIDWPAGLVEKHSAEETARVELEEETGYTCASVELLAKGPSSPGITSEVISFYRAKSVSKQGDGGGVEGEDITVHVVPLDEMRQWLEKREAMIDLKVWGGLYFLA